MEKKENKLSEILSDPNKSWEQCKSEVDDFLGESIQRLQENLYRLTPHEETSTTVSINDFNPVYEFE